MKLIKYHWQLDVYKLAVDAAMRLFELSKKFPVEERYSLTDQIVYDQILGKLVIMGNNSSAWVLEKSGNAHRSLTR